MPALRRLTSTAIPDEIFDVYLAELSDAELRVLLYIARHTTGYRKDADKISLKQYMEGITTWRRGKEERVDQGCGIKNRTTVSKAIKGLVARGLIVATHNRAPQGDADVTSYRLHFQGDEDEDDGDEDSAPEQMALTAASPAAHPASNGHRAAGGSTANVLRGGTVAVPTTDTFIMQQVPSGTSKSVEDQAAAAAAPLPPIPSPTPGRGAALALLSRLDEPEPPADPEPTPAASTRERRADRSPRPPRAAKEPDAIALDEGMTANPALPAALRLTYLLAWRMGCETITPKLCANQQARFQRVMADPKHPADEATVAAFIDWLLEPNAAGEVYWYGRWGYLNERAYTTQWYMFWAPTSKPDGGRGRPATPSSGRTRDIYAGAGAVGLAAQINPVRRTCPECGGSWIKFQPSQHAAGCSVAALEAQQAQTGT